MTDQTRLQGVKIGSQNEANVAEALDKLELAYEYQYIVGLMGVRGSQIIDFLCYTVPLPTPLFVHGEYWHSGKLAAEDELKMHELMTMTRNKWAEPVIIWGEESETVEDAVNAIRKALML